MKKGNKYAALVFLVALLSLSMLAPACATQGQKEPITIGVVVPLTGFLIDPGTCHNQGLQVAIEEAPSEIAGRSIKFVVEDEASDPGIAVEKVRKLVETNKASMIIGPMHSGSAMAIADYVAKMEVPVLALFSHAVELALKYPWIWNIVGTMSKGGYVIGAYAYDVPGYRTATTLTIDYSAGHEFIGGFLDMFSAKGGKIVQEQLFPMGTTDFAPYITGLAIADVLIRFVPSGMQEMGFRRQLAEFGVKIPEMAPQAQPEASYISKAYKDLAVGFTYATPYVWTIDTPENQKFVEAFKKKWNGDWPGALAAAAYTDVKLALEAIRKTGGDTSGEALASALDKVSIQSPMGPISFKDRMGTGLHYVAIIEKLDGDYVPKILGTYRVESEKTADTIIYAPTMVK